MNFEIIEKAIRANPYEYDPIMKAAMDNEIITALVTIEALMDKYKDDPILYPRLKQVHGIMETMNKKITEYFDKGSLYCKGYHANLHG